MPELLIENTNLLLELQPLEVSLSNLYLNPNNPRIMGKARSSNLPDDRIMEEKIQDSIESELKSEGLNDIIEKVKKVGFLPIDRIVVRKIKNASEKYVVLEGNRRIASLKILLKEHNKGIDTLPEHVLKSISKFEVLLYNGNDEHIEWLLQGLRHINGIKQWGALQQARFLYEMQELRKLSPTDLNKMTALGRTNIANTLRAYKGWLQAQQEFDGEIKEEHFSLFQEAIFRKPRLKEWLEWEDGNGFKNEENFQQLLRWYVGDENGKQKISRVLDIRDTLTEIMADENKEIFDKLRNNEDYTFQEAEAEYRKKTAEKVTQKDQLDLNHRLSELDRLYSVVSTLPIPQISELGKKEEFKEKIEQLKKAIEMISNIFNSL